MDFIDLKTQYGLIKDSIQHRMSAVFQHGNYIMGPEIGELEKILAEYVGVKHCLTCSSGTDALLIPLMAWDIRPGDAIFTTPFTFIATAEVIALLGATPVFVDIDEKTYNIDPGKLEEAIIALENGKRPSLGSPARLRPRGIIPVDLFGLPAEYNRINVIAKKHGLFVLEDAAQSFGAEYYGRKSCNLAEVAATSFFPAKPLGCYGDGGAIFTNNTEFALKMESIRVHGKGSDKYDNVRIGINGRLDTMQAAVLLSKMEIFQGEIQQRQIVASRYSKALQNKATVPFLTEDCISAWAQYSLLSDHREEAMKKLKDAAIPTAIYYPKPLHLQTAFSFLEYPKGSMPVAEKIAQKVFSLPMHPYLTEQVQAAIIKAFG